MKAPELFPPVVFRVAEAPAHTALTEGVTVIAFGEVFTVTVVVAVVVQPELVCPVVVSSAVTV